VNAQLITSDLSRGLYSPAYVNFLSSVPRQLLEDFASQIASTGAAEHVAQVFDQYLNFIVAEPDLFSLGLGNDSYWKINSAQTSDEDLDDVVDKIVSGLFDVSVTMGMSYLRFALSLSLSNFGLQEPFLLSDVLKGARQN
jgi:hypothetical protein